MMVSENHNAVINFPCTIRDGLAHEYVCMSVYGVEL